MCFMIYSVIVSYSTDNIIHIIYNCKWNVKAKILFEIAPNETNKQPPIVTAVGVSGIKPAVRSY